MASPLLALTNLGSAEATTVCHPPQPIPSFTTCSGQPMLHIQLRSLQRTLAMCIDMRVRVCGRWCIGYAAAGTRIAHDRTGRCLLPLVFGVVAHLGAAGGWGTTRCAPHPHGCQRSHLVHRRRAQEWRTPRERWHAAPVPGAGPSTHRFALPTAGSTPGTSTPPSRPERDLHRGGSALRRDARRGWDKVTRGRMSCSRAWQGCELKGVRARRRRTGQRQRQR